MNEGEFPEFVVGEEPSFTELARVMGEDNAAGYEGTLHINLPGELPFVPKHLFVNGIEYVLVERDDTDGVSLSQ